MTSDIELGIATIFRDAIKQNIALELRTQADWDRYNAIDRDARQRTEDELDSFAREQPERLAAARKAIIDEAGSLTHHHPTPFGTDRFDKSAIEHQARARVVHAHQTKLLKINSDETDALDGLRQDIHAREGVRGIARDAFARGTDRRDGAERRAGPER